MAHSGFLNKDILWALSDAGLNALNSLVQKGMDADLAFELLSQIFMEEELFGPLKEPA